MTLGDTELVWVEPRGTRRLPAIKQIDLRVEKRFSLGRSRQLGISGDVFNLTNQGVPNSDLLTYRSVNGRWLTRVRGGARHAALRARRSLRDPSVGRPHA